MRAYNLIITHIKKERRSWKMMKEGVKWAILFFIVVLIILISLGLMCNMFYKIF